MRRMLCIILALASIIMITGCGGGDDDGGGGDKQGLVLNGYWYYHWDLSPTRNLKTMRLENNDGGEVFNDSDVTTGDLILALVFSTERYDGGDDINGYMLWRMDYNPIAPGASISYVDSTQDMDMPTVGDYYVYLILAEYSIQDGTYHIRDNILFDNMVRVTGPWDMETIN